MTLNHASGPMVTRRVGHHGQHGAKPSAAAPRPGSTSSGVCAEASTEQSRLRQPLVAPARRPSIRQTIESVVSTCSQADYFKPDQTIIIFDWDDTLCPSSWIRANKRVMTFFKPAPKDERYQRPLRELQRQVEILLKTAMKLGNVVIVTNAQDPWVDTSCRNFLPQLMPLVKGLPVIYARTIYETHCLDKPRSPSQWQSRGGLGMSRSSSAGRIGGGTTALPGLGNNSVALPGLYSAQGRNKLTSFNTRLATQVQFDELAPQRWKEVAFMQEITGFYSRYAHQSWKNVISVGDSVFERDAVRRVVMERPSTKKKCRTKTLKLFDDPDIDELIQQVRIVIDVLTMMVQYDGELDIEIDAEDLKGDAPLCEHFHQ